MAESKTTTNHDAIRCWADGLGEHPAAVSDTACGGGAGILRIASGVEFNKLGSR